MPNPLNPVPIDREGQADEPFLLFRERFLRGDIEANTDQRHKKQRKDDKGQHELAKVPRDDPGEIQHGRNDKDEADFIQQRRVDRFALAAKEAELIEHIADDKQIDHAPDGKCQRGGDKQVGITVGNLLGGYAVDG